jgi:hypothetical protein
MASAYTAHSSVHKTLASVRRVAYVATCNCEMYVRVRIHHSPTLPAAVHRRPTQCWSAVTRRPPWAQPPCRQRLQPVDQRQLPRAVPTAGCGANFQYTLLPTIHSRIEYISLEIACCFRSLTHRCQCVCDGPMMARARPTIASATASAPKNIQPV